VPVVVRTRGLVLIEHEFSVPLDHARTGGEQITVFAREVADPDGLDRPFCFSFKAVPARKPRARRDSPAGRGGSTVRSRTFACSCSISAAQAGRHRSVS